MKDNNNKTYPRGYLQFAEIILKIIGQRISCFFTLESHPSYGSQFGDETSD